MPTILFCNNKQVAYLHIFHTSNIFIFTPLLFFFAEDKQKNNYNYYLELYPTFLLTLYYDSLSRNNLKV